MNELEDVTEQIEQLSTWMPTWLVVGGLYLLFLATALVGHKMLFRALKRVVAERSLFWRSLVSRSETLALVAFIVLGLLLATGLAPLEESGTRIAAQVLAVCVVGLIALVVRMALHIWMTLYLRRFSLDTEDNLYVRKHVTQVRILQRVADTLIIVVAISAMLMSIDGVRQFGVSLLASAGAAGIVAALALQPLLKNLFAGIQLAITQPIRIDDVLVVEGEWVRVEEITSTYVVLRVWDLRRLILPLSYFIEQPFENWTREGAEILGAVSLYLDYQAPMEAIRAKAEDIAKSSKLWDKKVLSVQVTDCEVTTMKVRILLSAHNSSDAWDLRCLVREQIISWLQQNHPGALPRSRTLVVGAPQSNSVAAAIDPGIDQGGVD